jgi:hypothetical protein
VRVLTAILALVLTFGGSFAAPVSRIETGRDSCAIVWIAAEEFESCAVAAPPARRTPAPLVSYTTRLVQRPALHHLFQRPPPAV